MAYDLDMDQVMVRPAFIERFHLAEKLDWFLTQAKRDGKAMIIKFHAVDPSLYIVDEPFWDWIRWWSQIWSTLLADEEAKETDFDEYPSDSCWKDVWWF